MYRYLVVDGFFGGTGIRDEYSGEYYAPGELGLSAELLKRIEEWLDAYRELHLSGHANVDAIDSLDSVGLEISHAVAEELPNSKVSYYSDAKLTKRLDE